MFTTTIFVNQKMLPPSRPPPPPFPPHPPHPPPYLKLNERETYKRSFDAIFGTIVIILNAIQIILICRVRRKKTIYLKFLLSLSVTDLLFGLSNVIVCAIYLADVQEIDFLRDIAYSVFCFCILTSITFILWIALSRLFAVVYPFQNTRLVTHKRVHIIIILTWFFNAFYSAGILAYQRIKLSSRTQSHQFEDKVKLSISIAILCANVVYIALYSFIIHRIRQESNIKKVNKANVDSESEKRMLIVCILVALVFVLFTTPYPIARISTGKTPFWTNALLVINSGVNSIAYFFRGRFQDWRKSVIRKKTMKLKENQNVDSDVTANYSAGSTSLEIMGKPNPGKGNENDM